MSLRIINPGILDTIQDAGRYGYQHLGINPGGAMDRFSAILANSLLGKEAGAPVIEMHFPAPDILFEQQTIICITGADFSPRVDDVPVPLNQPVVINKYGLLTFAKWVWGARCYLANINTFNIEKWLNSFSTHLKARAGGLYGRALQKNDVIPLKEQYVFSNLLEDKPFYVLPWKAHLLKKMLSAIAFIKGAEWHWLKEEAKGLFQKERFVISPQADRMGYRLKGGSLSVTVSEQLVSAGVSFGTIQLLPNGQLILLMADHQTTGGYPKIAHVVAAHLPLLAQMRPGDAFTFEETTLQTAEEE